MPVILPIMERPRQTNKGETMRDKKPKAQSKDWLLENWDSYASAHLLRKDCAKAMGRTSSSVRSAYRKIVVKGLKKPHLGSSLNNSGDEIDTTSTDGIVSQDMFLQDLGIIDRIIKFIDEVVKTDYIYDDKLRRRMGVTSPEWKMLIRHPDLQSRWIKVDDTYGRQTKVVVWSSPAGIEQAKKTINKGRYSDE